MVTLLFNFKYRKNHQCLQMQISLVVFQLEVKDEAVSPENLSYCAPNFKMAEPEFDDLSEETLNRYRGRRDMQKIQVETIEIEEETNEHHDDDDTEIIQADTDDAMKEPSEDIKSADNEEWSVGEEILLPENLNFACSDNSKEKDEMMNENFATKSKQNSSDVHSSREDLQSSRDDLQSSRDYAAAVKRRHHSEGNESGSPGNSMIANGNQGAVSKRNTTPVPVSSFREQFQPIDSRNSPVTCDDGSNSRPGSARSRPVSHSPLSKIPSTVHFKSGNPMVECTEGILHLYKENQMTPLSDDTPRSEMICILAVPATMTTRDLMQFTAPLHPGIEHMRIIRDHTPNQYMVLIKFKDQKYADEFYSVFNNTTFNSLEPDVCYLVYVARVETVKSSQGAGLPIPGLTELPKCPICLARMDETVEGILTILCNHSFHGLCLSQWGDTSCPVCRYCQTPEISEGNKCSECGATESLWICLICGHVGCGRYVEGHASSHYEETQHTYTMQLSNSRVWDYVGDNYVHRLIQNKGDGKLVEVDERGNMVQEEKMDSLTLEYTYLLTSQLESQRHYFEEKMNAIENDAQKQIEEVENRSKQTVEECEQLNKKLSNVTKEKNVLERRCQLLTTKVSKLTSELQDEKTLNECLRKNQQQWQDKVMQLETKVKEIDISKQKEIQDLQEQLRDVMFYLEAQRKVAEVDPNTREEIQHGRIVVGDPSPTSGHKKGKKKKR